MKSWHHAASLSPQTLDQLCWELCGVGELPLGMGCCSGVPCCQAQLEESLPEQSWEKEGTSAKQVGQKSLKLWPHS